MNRRTFESESRFDPLLSLPTCAQHNSQTPSGVRQFKVLRTLLPHGRHPAQPGQVQATGRQGEIQEPIHHGEEPGQGHKQQQGEEGNLLREN